MPSKPKPVRWPRKRKVEIHGAKLTVTPIIVKLGDDAMLKLLRMIIYWEGRCKKIGLLGSKCLAFRDKKDAEKRVTIGGVSLLPYQWMYLFVKWNLPQDPRSISHWCGDGRCLSVCHMLDEERTINVHERRECHRVINGWISWMRSKHVRLTPNSRYTLALCKEITPDYQFGRVCEHKDRHCFVSVGDGSR